MPRLWSNPVDWSDQLRTRAEPGVDRSRRWWEPPLSEPVQITVDGVLVPALLLKWDRQRAKALVTFEREGHVETRWVPAELLDRSPVH